MINFNEIFLSHFESERNTVYFFVDRRHREHFLMSAYTYTYMCMYLYNNTILRNRKGKYCYFLANAPLCLGGRTKPTKQQFAKIKKGLITL